MSEVEHEEQCTHPNMVGIPCGNFQCTECGEVIPFEDIFDDLPESDED